MGMNTRTKLFCGAAVVATGLGVLQPLPAEAQSRQVLSDTNWTVETTPVVSEAINDGDADDPAFWVDPVDPSNVLIVGTRKQAGLAVYDLSGNQVFQVSPPDDDTIRFNNVEVVYNFPLGGEAVDLVVVTDRREDWIQALVIDPTAPELLTNVTSPNQPRAFQPGPDRPPSDDETAYGLATYYGPDGEIYAFASQDETNRVRQFRLFDDGVGVSTELVRTLSFPDVAPDGTPLDQIDNPNDPDEGLEPQIEGMVVDQTTGTLYVGQENVGIWVVDAAPVPVDVSIDYAPGNPIELIIALDPDSPLTQDVEGLTLFYGENGAKYLFASSQGDSTYAVYDLENNNAYLGSFVICEAVAAGGGACEPGGDDVQDSDGADLLALVLPGFDEGVLVVHDGEAEPGDPDFDLTNFKYVGLDAIEAGFVGVNGATLDLSAKTNPRQFAVPVAPALALFGLPALLLLRRRRG